MNFLLNFIYKRIDLLFGKDLYLVSVLADKRTCSVLVVLYHAERRNIISGFSHCLLCRRNVGCAAIYKEEIRCDGTIVREVSASSAYGFTHRGIVVTSGYGFHSENAVVALFRLAVLKYDHSCGYMLVADV